MELNQEERKIREFIIGLAKTEETVSYHKICSELQLTYDVQQDSDMDVLSKRLTNVAVAYFDESNSLLSVVVISESSGSWQRVF